jgi:hypothetical protein
MKQSDRPNPQKRPYQKPVVKIFGSVKGVTASGSGQPSEGAAPEPQNCTPDRKLSAQCIPPVGGG